ncbi:hypothetical protein [Streptacidiphilus sp. MAP5-3]|uniref:hypothetical protein n=1 Tax=unclassified Streptacidiphilus TaxID=2643834 RepID=UPI0035182904
MPPELALVESRTLRASLNHRVEALDKVKTLIMLPDGTYVTTRMVASYFEVPESTIKNLTQRHRTELEANGFRILKGVDMSGFVGRNMSPTQVSGRGVAIYDRRAVLNVAMLLRDSTVARRVRSHLLDVEEQVVHKAADVPQPRAYRPSPGARLGPGPHCDEYEKTSSNPELEAWRRVIDGDVVDDPSGGEDTEDGLPPDWPESVDRRLDAMGRVTGAMSHKLDGVGQDVRRMRKDVNALRSDIHRANHRR